MQQLIFFPPGPEFLTLLQRLADLLGLTLPELLDLIQLTNNGGGWCGT